jgi:hypothetical protein
MLLSKRADPPANELRAGMENMLKHVQQLRTLLGALLGGSSGLLSKLLPPFHPGFTLI